MQQNEDIYYIPVNFTDAGRVLGLFELRNCIEAAVLAAPTVGLCTLIANLTPFSMTAKLIISLCLLVPACGFALVGIRDEPLSRFLITCIRWRKNRRIALNKGGLTKNERKRNDLRHTGGRGGKPRARKR